jgi:hypothetical protein
MLANAKRHVADLEVQSGIYLSSDPYAEVVEQDAKTGEHVFKVKLVKPMPPAFNGMASDAVNNLRFALDQAGYAVAVAAGGKGKNTHFPFGDSAADVRGCKGGGSREIPDQIFSLMEAFKPYRGGDDLLWALNKLCNANKHRIVSPVAIATGDTLKVNKLSVQGAPMIPRVPIWDRKKNEMEMFRFPATLKNFECNVDFTHAIAFNSVEAIRNQPALTVLHAVSSKVESVLMAVEAEARRIGLFK